MAEIVNLMISQEPPSLLSIPGQKKVRGVHSQTKNIDAHSPYLPTSDEKNPPICVCRSSPGNVQSSTGEKLKKNNQSLLSNILKIKGNTSFLFEIRESSNFLFFIQTCIDVQAMYIILNFARNICFQILIRQNANNNSLSITLFYPSYYCRYYYFLFKSFHLCWYFKVLKYLSVLNVLILIEAKKISLTMIIFFSANTFLMIGYNIMIWCF